MQLTHPQLKSLQLELSKFAYEYLTKSLDLPPPADERCIQSVEKLNAALLKYLVQDKCSQHL